MLISRASANEEGNSAQRTTASDEHQVGCAYQAAQGADHLSESKDDAQC